MAIGPEDFTTYESFDAEKVSLYVQQSISREGLPGLAQNTKYKAFLMANVDAMVAQLISWCIAGRIPSNKTTEKVEWPDGVWQMFKSRYMPEWFVTRFPVRTAHKNIDTITNHYFVCPHIVTDPQQTHVRFMMTARGSVGRSPWL